MYVLSVCFFVLCNRHWFDPMPWWPGVRRVCGWLSSRLARQCPGTAVAYPPPPLRACLRPWLMCFSHVRAYEFYLRSESLNAQKSLYNFTISEPFRNNSSLRKICSEELFFFGLYQTLL